MVFTSRPSFSPALVTRAASSFTENCSVNWLKTRNSPSCAGLAIAISTHWTVSLISKYPLVFYYFLEDHTGPLLTTFCFPDNCVRCTIWGDIIQFSIPSISSNNLQQYKKLLSAAFANICAMNYERIKGRNISLYSAVGENVQRIRLQSSVSSISYIEGFSDPSWF